MKHIYLQLALVLASSQLLAQNGQLANSGFENWENRLISETPDLWFDSNQLGTASVFKSTDAQDGTYSAEIHSLGPDESYGYIGLGELVAYPTKGVPYTSEFNTLTFQYQSEFEQGDSIYVYIVRFLNGAEAGEYISGTVSGSAGSWTEGTFEIPDGQQDSVFIAFMTGSWENNTRNSTGSWFRIDNVKLLDNEELLAPLPNFSLENWTALTTEEPVNWFTQNPFLIDFLPAGTVKITDAHSGNFAAQLSAQEFMQFGSPVVMPSILSLIPVIPGAANGIPYAYTPGTLKGWYKLDYSASGLPDATLIASFYNDGELCGGSVFNFQNNDSWTEFTAPVTFTGTPDSIQVNIASGDEAGTVLKIDDLQFSGGTLGLEDFEKSVLSVFPNPATDKVMIKAEGNYAWEIVNISGTVVMNGNASSAQELDLTGVSAGTYFVRLSSGTEQVVEKLVVN